MRLVRTLLTASIVLITTEAVVACTLVDSASSDIISRESQFALQTYHPVAVLIALGIALLVYIRKGKGWYFLILPCTLLAMSPGWFPIENAGISATCEPRWAFEMKVILAVILASFAAQLTLWIRTRTVKLR